MKRYILKSLYLVGLLFTVSSCYNRDIEGIEPQLQAVSNLQYTLVGDSVKLTWSLPQGHDSLSATVKCNDQTISINRNNPTSYTFGVVEVNKDYGFTVKLKDTQGNQSLGQTVRFNRAGAKPVTDFKAVQNDNNVSLSWTLPDETLSGLTLKIGSQTVALTPTTTSYQINNASLGKYTFSLVTKNAQNQISHSVYLDFKVGPTAVAYLGVYADSLSIGDDDEMAGAKWLFKTYPTAQYISFDDIKNNKVDLSQFRIIWWNFDVETGHALPAISTDANVVDKIKQYYKNGGNMLFNTYALQYLWTLGRITNQYKTEFGDGGGWNDGGTWWVNVNINGTHDWSTHPLFKGFESQTQTWEGNRRVFPMLGSGWKENHNAVIVNIPEYYKLPNNSEDAYTKFNTDNNAKWLATWDGIRDFWMGGIFEFMPKDDFQGSSIFIGLGPIEWNQNTGNIYQSNIELLYKNSIEYLKTK